MEKDIKDNDPLEYELDEYVIGEIERLAEDEFSSYDNEIFFYGKIINADSWMNAECIDERKYYSVCPSCDKLIKLKKKPNNGDYIECPHCTHSGYMYDFRNPDAEIDEPTVRYAYLEKFDKGYVLRLFDSKLDYSDREYDNYEILSCYPYISTVEKAREYWCESQIYCYCNSNTYEETPFFVNVDKNEIDDSGHWIVNYENEYDPMSSSTTDDIMYDDPYKSRTCIEVLTRGIPYNTFHTLKKYGFYQLISDMIYVPSFFCDSNKISEILQADYNKIKAEFDIETVNIKELEAIRLLQSLNLEITSTNADIAIELKDSLDTILKFDKPRNIFKYLRNQIHKSQCKARDYADYIQECTKLNYDLTSMAVRYPSNLGETHRKTSALINIENNEFVETEITKVYESLHKSCEWSDGNLSVIMPKSIDDILTEGAMQNHCVGNYCERVAKRESIILFVRRAESPNKPYYTMEIRPIMKKLDIVQCRGYRNSDPSPEAREEIDAFLNKYTNWFNRRPIEIQENTTRIYYKAVHKTDNGQYISAWDNKTEYVIGKTLEAKLCTNPDRVAANGIHIASLEFAQKYGNTWSDVAILEIEVDMKDVIIPDAKDQIRASKVKVLREVPMSELGEWGKRHMQKQRTNVA